MVWALAMLAFGVSWWDFEEHGPWLTPIAPLLLAGAAERAVLRGWPEWERDHEPDADAGPTDAVGRMGDRVRPAWAREDADPDDLSDRTRPSP